MEKTSGSQPFPNLLLGQGIDSLQWHVNDTAPSRFKSRYKIGLRGGFGIGDAKSTLTDYRGLIGQVYGEIGGDSRVASHWIVNPYVSLAAGLYPNGFMLNAGLGISNRFLFNRKRPDHGVLVGAGFEFGDAFTAGFWSLDAGYALRGFALKASVLTGLGGGKGGLLTFTSTLGK